MQLAYSTAPTDQATFLKENKTFKSKNRFINKIQVENLFCVDFSLPHSEEAILYLKKISSFLVAPKMLFYSDVIKYNR